MEQDGPRERAGFRAVDHATRWAGILLCWAHAAAMVLTAAEAMLGPTSGWWVVTWALTAVLFIAWALLRLAQKRLHRPTAGAECGDADPCCPEEPLHYDRAA